MSNLCSSTFCADVGKGYQCGSGVKSYANPPLICESDSACISTLDDTLGIGINGKCDCAYSMRAGSYCSLFPGDVIS